ncbi:MAG: amino acid ABC transporter permease, partial [Rhodobacteraceae bacterium]|nr:amino acid ABC transporter permease [Paracoccaceae bacterium]
IALKTHVKLELSSATIALNKEETTLSALEKRLQSVQSLPTFKEELSVLINESDAGRDSLPSSVANLSDLEDVAADTPKEAVDELNNVLTLEEERDALQQGINSIYQEVGFVGLEPVASREFGGFMLAITLGITGIALSFPIGIVLALGRQSNLVIIKSLCVGFIEFIRGVPLITLLFVAQVMLAYFLPKGTQFDIILRVMIMITLFAAAYMAEVIRGGLAALPTGQYEAADALGLDYWQAQRLIIMPQALKISIPGIVSTFIGLFKDTTLVSIISLSDPIGWAKFIQANAEWNGIVWELYGFIAFVFFIFCFSMSRYSMYLERKLQTGH